MESLGFRPPPSTFYGPLSTSSSAPHAHRRLPFATVRPTGPMEEPPAGQISQRPSSHLALPRSLWRLWPDQDDGEERRRKQNSDPQRAWRGSWVMKILRIRSIIEGEGGGRRSQVDGDAEEERESVSGSLDQGECCDGEDCCCDVAEVEIDRDLFSKLLRRASLPEAELYARMSYLSLLAYSVSKIKPSQLLEDHGLRFVASSLERKPSSPNAEARQEIAGEKEREGRRKADKSKSQGEGRIRLSASGVYGVVASAASYIHSQTRSILPIGQVSGNDSPEGGDVSVRLHSAESLKEASFFVTSESVTAVVAAEEEVKQAVADDLNSSLSSPCDWFICDDDASKTRYFVIQGSMTLASWQANLLFEPIRFEGMDVLVHRGIYEAAKGIYQQMLPEVRAHLESHGCSATLRFTGHSLGGSLCLLINLMLLIRGEAPASSLLPVITFGAPSIFCGGNSLLEKLGLPRSHVQAVTLHRDIVPRAFSCTYPDRVAYILKAVNANFRNHPCLNHQKLLYSPMGEILILQPDKSFSPHHHLLPSGSGLYFLGHSLLVDATDSRKLLRTAFSVFLNKPHPLEILSDRAAYGADGTVMRDHDVSSYLRAVQAVIRAERKKLRKAQREHRQRSMWSLLDGNGLPNPLQFDVSGALQGMKEPIERLTRLAGSQKSQLLFMLFFPVRMLVLHALTVATSV